MYPVDPLLTLPWLKLCWWLGAAFKGVWCVGALWCSLSLLQILQLAYTHTTA